jgi:hypothetical protein
MCGVKQNEGNMEKLEIIGRIIRTEDAQVLKQIEDLLLSAEALSEEPPAPQKEKTYRIKGENGVVFELGDNFGTLKTFRNGKHLSAEDRTLRAVTRGYLEMLITNAGSFVKRSEIEKHIQLRDESESASRISGKTYIHAVFRYTQRTKSQTSSIPLPIYRVIETVESWDPEYCIPSKLITVLKTASAS